MHDVDTLIVGAGVVGLAIARTRSMAGHEVLVLEQHDCVGSEISARNSEVIHAGIYYPKGSWKARLCVQGKKMLYAHCKSHGVPHRRLGKLIVASNESQVEKLHAIRLNAQENGVNDLAFLDGASLQELEPALRAVSGLLSPSTGIVDSHALMLSLQGDAEAHGCQIAFNSPALSWRRIGSGGFTVDCGGAEPMTLSTRSLIVSCGLHTSSFLAATLSEPSLTVRETLYAKGNYFRLTGRAPFDHLVYPVPEPGGLGVHLTLDMAGQARFGPDVEWVGNLDYRVDPGRAAKFYGAIRCYWPELPDNSLEPDYSGIRPKLSGPGEQAADFEILGPPDHGISGLVALLGIESPGLTASMAIADHVQSLLEHDE